MDQTVIAEKKTKSGGPPFISLKWKALVLSSLLLIGITATISGMNYVNLMSLYQSQRDDVFNKYTLQVEGLLSRSARNLQSMASMISNLHGVKTAMQAGDYQALQSSIDKHWLSLQIDSGIETLQFYDQKNTPLVSRNMNEDSIPDAMLWVSRVNISEQPVTVIECADSCMQMSIVPILIQGEHVGVVLLARSLADIVLDFKNIAGSDVGVMIRSDRQGSDKERYIDQWGYRVVALTNWKETSSALHYAASISDFPQPSNNTLDFQYSNKDYEIRSFRLNGDDGNASIIIIDDVTAERAIIGEDNARNITTGVIGLFVAEALLLALLWRPMTRLRITALALPLLSERKYAKAKQSVEMERSLYHIDDETDVLVDTTIKLSDQLEKYHAESQAHMQDLARRTAEMEAQKDFVTSLIQTANAIIITQNNQGEIVGINDYGEELLGLPASKLIGSPFTRIVADDSLTVEVFRDVADLNAGRRARLNHELKVSIDDRPERYISWYHSRMPGGGDLSTSILTVGHDVTERINAEKSLSWLADHDSLTGMCNRRRFQIALDAAIDESLTTGDSGAMLFMDLDQFKDVNDSSGHQAGDLLLKEVAACLSAIIDEDGLIARIGGDEFAIILTKVSESAAIDMARKIQDRLAQVSLPIKDRIHSISSSIGIAMFPEHGDNSNDVFACADLAMYQAKEHGRGCWYIYSRTEKIRERLNERLHWKGMLERALELDLFQLYYQPITTIRNGETRHFEALLRYVEEDGTVTLPGPFIKIAESSGLIHAVDRVVISKAIRQLAWLQKEGLDINFSVNLSAHAFSDPGLFDLIKSLLQETELEPTRLILEVTETAAIADFKMAQAYITAIKKLGCRFALDDFGVGFSSFYSLKQLPVDYVKIDGSFIKSLHSNADDQVLVRSLAQAAHGFGKKTIAEFVEDPRTLEKLSEFDVDYAQGYLLGKPMPAEEVFKVRLPVFSSTQR